MIFKKHCKQENQGRVMENVFLSDLCNKVSKAAESNNANFYRNFGNVISVYFKFKKRAGKSPASF